MGDMDMQKAIEFFCVFGCIAYQIFYWGPAQMFDFLLNDFMKLSMINQGISIFIAASIAFFILILTKNCLCLQKMVIRTNKSDDDVDVCQKDIVDDDDLSFCELSIGLDQCNEIKEQKKKSKRRRRRKKKKKKALD